MYLIVKNINLNSLKIQVKSHLNLIRIIIIINRYKEFLNPHNLWTNIIWRRINLFKKRDFVIQVLKNNKISILLINSKIN
jgi:hypothetical protein